MRSKFKLISLVSVLLLFVLFFALKFFFVGSKFYTPFLEGVYWLWFVLVVDISWILGLKSRHLLYPSLFFMILGAIFNVFGGFIAAEVILRLWVVVFLVGVILLLIESRNSLPRIKNG